MKKFITIPLLVLALFISAATVNAQQSKPEKLYQQALYEMEALGNFAKAIELFNRVASEFPKEKALAAKALLHVGMCHEKLGGTEAQKAYERVIKEFADQREAVKEARARLIALGNGRKPEEKLAMTTRQIWAGSDVDILGAPSPDGRVISYTDWETGDLAIRDLVTGEKHRLTNKAPGWVSSELALFSVPSPDGKKVAYAWLNKDWFFDLSVIGVGDSTPRILYRNEEVGSIQPHDWSRDGKSILASLSRKDGTNQIVLVTVADGSVRVLKTLDWRYSLKMSLSPDGRYIVYDVPQKEDVGEHDIFLLATDGSREIPLIKHPANDLYPVWTPDGKKILFASDRTGSLGAWIINVADGKPQGSPEIVKPDIGRVLPMGFTRQGSFFYGLQTGTDDAYTAEMDPTTGKILTPPEPIAQHFMGSNFSPDWSPDGKNLVYISRRGPVPGGLGSSVLAIRSVETGEERELSIKMRFFRRPRWSPDGQSLLVIGRDKKSLWGLYRIDAQTGNVTAIMQSEPGSHTQWAEWSADGKAVFFNEFNRKDFRISMRDLETGQEKELLRGTVQDFAVSPDGQQLVLSFSNPKSPSNSLLLISTAGGEPRVLLREKEGEIVTGITGFRGLAWTHDGKSVLYIKKANSDPKDETFELWRVPIDGGERQSMGLTMSGLRNIRLHPNGKRIAFTAGKNKSEVWVMENFLPKEERAQK